VTAGTDGVTVRVTVTDAWDQVVLTLPPGSTVADLKREALARALGRVPPAEEYVVKFRGALVLDESRTPAVLGAGANAPFIVLPARRRPVR
jgi:hypothetical protein